MLPYSALRFQEALKSFDPLLSLRWGPIIQQWVIQRRSLIPPAEMTFLQNERGRLERRINSGSATEKQRERYFGVAEEHECALQSCRVILFVKEFSPQIFDTLALGDIQRYGGYSRYTDKQDELVEQKEKIHEKEQENQRALIHSETWGRRGIYDFLTRKKQTELNQYGVRNMNTLLEGSREFKNLQETVTK